MSSKHTIVGLAEILWDLLPSGRQLGGAPANFAYFANLLGNHGVVASRVGDDPLGREAAGKIRNLGSCSDYLQCDSVHPTGTVQVSSERQFTPFCNLPQTDYVPERMQ